MAVQTIINPQARTVNIAVEPGQDIAFDFDLDSASFERSGSDLSVTLDDGGRVLLSGFFVADENGGLPSLQLADGTRVDSGDFLSALDVDVTPAAAGPAGGGLNAYDDGSGSLVGGLDLSDSLDNFQWGYEVDRVEEYVGLPGQDVDGAPPVEAAYHARAVLYEPDPNAHNALGFNVRLGEPGDALEVAASANGYVRVGVYTNPNGENVFHVELSPEGLQAMRDAQNEGRADNLYDYITLSDGTVIQVILNQNGTYNSQDEDRLNDPGVPVAGEWHTQNSVTGHTDEIYSETSNGLNNGLIRGDEVWLTSLRATNGTVNTLRTYIGPADGQTDAIHVAEGIMATSRRSGPSSRNILETGQGAGNSISVGATVMAGLNASNILVSHDIDITAVTGYSALEASNAGLNTLTAGGDVNISASDLEDGLYGSGVGARGAGSANEVSALGDVHIQAQSVAGNNASGLLAADGGDNRVQAENVDVRAASLGDYAYGLHAAGDGSQNSVEAGVRVTITAERGGLDNFALYARDNGINLIRLGDGGGEVNLHGDVHAESGGMNRIYGGAGDDSFRLDGHVGADALFIDGGGGRDTLVLMAPDYADFVSRYDAWLSNPASFDNIEAVRVECGALDAAAYQDLSNYLSTTLGAYGTDIVFENFTFSGNLADHLGSAYLDGGDGFQTARIGEMGVGGGHGYSLSDLTAAMHGYEQLDLNGGAGTTLTIDSLLGGLGSDATYDDGTHGEGMALFITGDGGDSVLVNGNSGWNDTGSSAQVDGLDYYVYSNNDLDDPQYLLIQHGLI